MIIILIVLSITALEFYALHKGVDGYLLWCVIGTLSTIAGWWGKKNQVEKARKREQRSPDAMSDTLNELICSILQEAEERASKTANKVDDIVVKFLKSVCRCK